VAITPVQIIGAKAQALGGRVTGWQAGPLETVTGGYRIHYDFCDIYYSPATGAHEVRGDIRNKYHALGGADSALGLGLPATDQLVTSDGVGHYNEFSGNASIYLNPNTGPMMVRGAIRAAWVANGAQAGPAGYPTSDEIALGGGSTFNDFQNSDPIVFDGANILHCRLVGPMS
jgi:uncharacterized protein with LGFP repeats